MPVYSIDGLIPVVAPGAFVHPDAVLIGDVHIGPNCYIGPNATLRGDFGRIIVGEGSNVQDGCVMHAFPGQDLILHPEAHIGHGAVLHGCVIHSRVLVGMNSVIMDGAVVGENALVGAGCVIAAGKEFPARHLIAGNPAKVIKELDEVALAWKVNGVKTYQELAVRSLATMSHVEPLPEAEPDRPRLQPQASAAKSVPLHELREKGQQ